MLTLIMPELETTPVYSVAEFSQILNGVFGEIGEFSVQGEIISLRYTANRAVFIELKDKQEQAILKINNYAPRLEGLNAVKEGMEVVVTGPLELYAPYGTVSLRARTIRPVGEGSLKAAFEQLQKNLAAEGLFAPERKRDLPPFVCRIALISGAGSAAYADFTKILHEAHAGIEIDFYPVLVQGASSAAEVSRALATAGSGDYDAICLVRGGGSLEDLQSFNSEPVARAIFANQIPVICGVGHEVDTTIADLVADVRASTPSQAAYYLLARNQAFLADLLAQTDSFASKLEGLLPSVDGIGRTASNWEASLRRHLPSPQTLGYQTRNLESGLNRLQHQVRTNLALCASAPNWQNQLQLQLNFARQRSQQQQALLQSYDPRAVLRRGYTIALQKGKAVSRRADVQPGHKLALRFFDGELEVTT